MKGINRIAGRNNNRMDLNPDGSMIMSSIGSSITINTELVNENQNITPPANVIIPNPTPTTASNATGFAQAEDIPPPPKPTGSKIIETNLPILTTGSQFLPDEEENFYFVKNYQDVEGIVTVTDESVTSVYGGAEYYGSAEGATVANNIKYDGTKISKDQIDIYVDGVGYQKQPNGWTCLVTNTVTIFDYERIKGTNKKYDLNWNSFTNLTANGGGGKFLKGKEFQTYAVTSAYPNFIQAERKTVNNPFEEYKKVFKKVRKPIIIRVAGTGKRSVGHFVVMVGITKDGNIIVHDPANSKVAFKDQVFTADRMLKVGEANNNINYQVLYIK